MSEKKVDRRIRRTRRLLGEALLDLLQEKDYESITVQEITDRADLNRATFYLHYESKQELLFDGLAARFDELVERMNQESSDKMDWGDCSSELMIFQHAADNAELYKVLLGERGIGYVKHQILGYIASTMMSDFERMSITDRDLTVPTEIAAQHIAGSLFALIGWWLNTDMPHSVEYMAEVSRRLCIGGILPPEATPTLYGADEAVGIRANMSEE
ncbi:TetR/AcrR family transcriptional regulator [Chloroflexi bacterium TSY]|nr:TetR/AcrR family transcriptional regulator [Chloroflexi bacterium TSY]